LGDFVGACGRFDLHDKCSYLELTSSKRIVPRMWVRRKQLKGNSGTLCPKALLGKTLLFVSDTHRVLLSAAL
jgi:hypothetical protein